MAKKKRNKDEIPIIAWIGIIISATLSIGLFTWAFLIKFGVLG